jgi:hypothetical protein
MAIAAGSLATYFVYAAAVLWYVSGYFDLAWTPRLRFLAGALLPGVLLGLALAFVEHTVPYRASAAATAATCMACVAVLGPLALRARALARQLDT